MAIEWHHPPTRSHGTDRTPELPLVGSRVAPPANTRLEEIAIVGAHGGAGATTLCALLQPAADLGVFAPSSWAAPPRDDRPVVLVTGTTTSAAQRASKAAAELTGLGYQITVLAVISDGLPDPGQAAYRLRLLRARVAAVVRVPFAAGLRSVAEPADARLPGAARRAIAEIRSQVQMRSAAPPQGWS
jgi:hypothetical protein